MTPSVEYLWLALIGAAATFFLYPELKSVWPNDDAIDAVSLGAFAVIGAMNGVRAHLAVPLVIVCGVLTATGGGTVRDVLTGKPVRILHSHKELYATTAASGAAAYLAVRAVGAPFAVRAAAGVATTVALRWGAWTYGWRLPTWTK